jgi:hypothetical protein
MVDPSANVSIGTEERREPLPLDISQHKRTITDTLQVIELGKECGLGRHCKPTYFQTKQLELIAW